MNDKDKRALNARDIREKKRDARVKRAFKARERGASRQPWGADESAKQ